MSCLLPFHHMISHWSLVGTPGSSIFMTVRIEKPHGACLSVLEPDGCGNQQTFSRGYKSDGPWRRTRLHSRTCPPSPRKRRQVEVGGVGAGGYRARLRSVGLECSGKQILKGRGDGAAAGPSTQKKIVKANALHFFPRRSETTCAAPHLPQISPPCA